MRSTILGFVAGAACIQSCAHLPDFSALIATALAAVALLVLAHGRCQFILRGVAGLMLGLCWAALLAQVSLAPELDKDDEGRDIAVIGTIDSLPYQFEQGVRFNFKVEKVEGTTMVPPRLSLAWYAGFRGKAQEPVGDVQPGERWRLTVRLQRPHGSANPYVCASFTETKEMCEFHIMDIILPPG